MTYTTEPFLSLSGSPGAATPNSRGIAAPTVAGRAYPLSFQQQSLWFLHQLDPSDHSYNESKAMRLKGALDRAALEQAFRDLIDGHAILRTVYFNDHTTPMQFIREDPAFEINYLSVEGQCRDARSGEALARIRARAAHPFDLQNDLPIRADLYAFAPNEHLLHVVVHHIAIDGWSWPILLDTLFGGYAAKTGRRQARAAPQPPALQYADYAVWQREAMTASALQPALDFWSKKLEGVEPLALPADRTRPTRWRHCGGTCALTLRPGLVERCRAFARVQRTTLFIVLLGAFKLLLARLSDQEDIVVGIPVAGRTEEQLEPLIGFFVNTVVARSRLTGIDSFADFLATVRADWLESLEHQDMPLSELVSALRPDRDPGRNPIFQAFFAFLRAPGIEPADHGLEIEPLTVELDAARFDIELSLQEDADGIGGHLIYNRDLFESAMASRIASRYLMLLEAAVSDPDASVWHLPMLGPEERRVMLDEWNRTEAEYPEGTLHKAFEDRVRKSPHGIAIRHGDVEVSRSDLNARANQIAARLRREGIGMKTPVALRLERSADYIAAALAVLKAGGVLVPVDAALPAARQSFILEDSGARAVITRGARPDLPLPEGLREIDLERDARALAGEPTEDTPSPATADNAAYILYTSGSTGAPKGVVGLHRGLLNRLHWMQSEYPFGPDDVCAGKTAIGFVDSMTEIFGPLLYGATLAVVDDGDVRDPRELVRALRHASVTRMVLVPSLLRALLETTPDIAERLPRLSFWACSGEALSPDLARKCHRLLPGRTLLNLYGSTEISGDATAADVMYGGAVTIGRPIANTKCYILDRRGEPVPVGVSGELHIGGDGLARGYHGRPDLTDARFLPDRFDGADGARMFRTGDRARFLGDGRIEFLGRNDGQLKLRGVRIEPGEIEAALRAIEGVSDAVVTPVPNAATVDHLVAHVLPRTPWPHLDWSGRLRAELEARLPAAFVPARLVEVDAIPRTASGKVDRIALSKAAARSDPDRRDAPRSAVPSETEDRLLEIWREVLANRTIDVRANFFELGGHSLLAVKLVSRIEEAFGTRLPVSALFEAPTVAKLVARMMQCPGRPAPVLLAPPCRRPQTRPLFCLFVNPFRYRELATALGDAVPTYGVTVEHGPRDERAPSVGRSRLEYLAERHIEQIRHVSPTGPYHLAGLSRGGLVAIEVARQLRAAGQEVGLLALLDTFAPRSPLKSRIARLRDRSRMLRRRRRVPEWLREAWLLQAETYRRLSNAPYSGDIVFIRALDNRDHASSAGFGWQRFVDGRIIVHDVPGAHVGMMRPPNVSLVARHLRSCLPDR